MAYKDMLDSFLRKKNSVTSNYGLDFPLMDAKTYDMANKVSNNVTSGPLSYRKPTTFENHKFDKRIFNVWLTWIFSFRSILTFQ